MKNNLAKYFVGGLLVLAGQSVLALSCDSTALKNSELHNLPGAGYWMQAFGDCRLTYTSVGGISSKMYNYCTHQVEPITNNIDAFPVPGEDNLYVHPYSGISFFKRDSITRNGENQPFYSDEEHTGNYQSIGLLSETPEKKVIRIAMGNQSGRYRDYEIKKRGNNFDIRPIQSRIVDVCKNIPSGGLDSQTPVLSRDGLMIAARDYSSSKTKVYKIKANGDCDLVQTIPSQTSKVSFNFDNKTVMYTTRDEDSGKGRLMQMNLASGETRSISGPDENVGYMTSKPDGSIIYSRSRNNNEVSDSSTSDLVILTPDLIADDSADKKAFEALGLMWAKACRREIDLDFAQAIGQRLNSDNCQSVVTAANLSSVESSVSLEKVKSVCAAGSSRGNSNSSSSGGVGR